MYDVSSAHSIPVAEEVEEELEGVDRRVEVVDVVEHRLYRRILPPLFSDSLCLFVFSKGESLNQERRVLCM